MIAQAAVVVFLAGCGGEASALDAGGDAPVLEAGTDARAKHDAADADPAPVDVGRVIPPCPSPVSGDGGVAVRGHAFTFGPSGGVVRDAVVTVVEHPGWCARTGTDGAYELTGFAPGEAVTLEMHHSEYWPIQTGTHIVPPDGMQRLGFQAPPNGIFRLLAQVVGIDALPDRCQIATTVVERGFSLYDPGGHGEVGATVTIDPPLPAESGPVYFRYLSPTAILPARELTETSLDGGVLFLNVPPGDYVLTAHKVGVRFTPVAIHCHAGRLVNASPPWGLQAL